MLLLWNLLLLTDCLFSHMCSYLCYHYLLLSYYNCIMQFMMMGTLMEILLLCLLILGRFMCSIELDLHYCLYCDLSRMCILMLHVLLYYLLILLYYEIKMLCLSIFLLSIYAIMAINIVSIFSILFTYFLYANVTWIINIKYRFYIIIISVIYFIIIILFLIYFLLSCS